MTERLKEMVEKAVIQAGKSGIVKLAARAEISLSTIQKARTSGHVSKATAYKLAVACGCSPEAAFQVAEECASEAKETA